MKRGKLLLLLVNVTLLIFFYSCAKESVSIGKGVPEDEMGKCIGLSMKKKFEDAIQCLEMFKARYPQTRLGQEAELRIGDAYYARKEYLLAAESYHAFLRLYPTHPKADYALYRAGLAYLKESPKAIDRDQGYLDDAIDNFRTVLRLYPDSSYAGIVRANLHIARLRVARRQFYIGRFYYRTGEYIACIPRFNEVAEGHPDSGLADRALYMMVKANLGLKRLDDAKVAFGKLSTDYPQSKYMKRAERKLLSAAKREMKN